MPTAVFGGTLEYPHPGHAGCVREMVKEFGLGIVAPTSQNPFKERKTFPRHHRIEMMKLLLQSQGIRLAKDRFDTGAFVVDFDYVYARDFIEWWWKECGFRDKIIWFIGPELLPETKLWSSGWFVGNPLVEFRSLPSQGDFRSTYVREGKMDPDPSIAGYLAAHGWTRENPVLD